MMITILKSRHLLLITQLLLCYSTFTTITLVRSQENTDQVGDDILRRLNNPQGEECPSPYNCDHAVNESYLVPNYPLRPFESTGCSAIGSGMNMNFGDNGQSYTDPALEPCCDVWNACYNICNTSKAFCDTKLWACMESACSKSALRDECQKSIKMKKLLVQLSSCRPFYLQQQKGLDTENEKALKCNCVLKNSVDSQRRGVLMDFYKQFSQDDDGMDMDVISDKVDNLLKKVSTEKQFAALMVKLVEKYPKSIVKVEAEPENKMPRNDDLNNLLPNDEL